LTGLRTGVYVAHVYGGTPLEPFGDLLEREFPRAGEGVFMNTAAQGLLPRRTLAAMAEFDSGRGWPTRIDDDRLAEVEATVRAEIAALVAAPVERVGLATNTSDGLSVAALHLPLEPGDRVLAARGEFPANVHPWLARVGIGVEFLEPAGAHLSAADYAARLDADPRIRAVAVSLVQFSTGHRHPVEAIARACRERGVFCVVDGIQGIGAVPFAWEDGLYDVVACGGQKWLCAPWGAGFFLAAEWLCREAEPVRAGWLQTVGARASGYAELCGYVHEFREDATRFEVGTYSYTALLGLGESVGLLRELGVERIHAHARALVAPLEAALAERGGELLACADDACRSGILCFRLGGPAATRRAFERLRAAGVACALREGAVRLAVHLYNTPADVERATEVALGAAPARAGAR
jgi:selenocysteine lyase/cysteine desulfurase